MARLRDLMMNMYNSDEEDDYDDHGDEEGRMEQGGRAAGPAPPQPADQRGEIYDDLLESVQLVSNCSVRVIELLEKCGAVEDCERVGNLVNRLAKLDEDLDKDRRAVDQTWREHGTDLSEELALEKYFKNIRKDIILERPGRNRELFDGMKEKLAQIPEKIATRENGQNGQQNKKRGRAGNVAADDEADESIEMEMLTQFMSDKDPITKTRINEPVKNSICGHVYDRDSIREYIRFNKERRQLQQCPVEMCRNKRNIEMEHLLPFPEFFQLVRRARSRSRSRQGRSRSRSRSRPRISTPQRRSNRFGTPSNGQGPSTSSAGN